MPTQEKLKRNNEIIRLKKQGKSYNELARYFNMSPQRIWALVKKNELKKISTGGKV